MNPNCKSVRKSVRTSIVNGVKTVETTVVTTQGGNSTTETTVETFIGNNDHKDHYDPIHIDGVDDEFKNVFAQFEKGNQFQGFQGFDRLGSKENIYTKNNSPMKRSQPKENVPSGDQFIDGSLERHNYYRRMHGVPDLVHNPDLTKLAQSYAEKLAASESFQHSNCKWGNKQVGENLAMCYGYQMTPEHSTDMWYDEIQDYDFNNPGFKSGTGHFTQVVWKDSLEVGFGLAQSKKGGWYSVANYFPAGNFMGRFKENVLPKQG